MVSVPPQNVVAYRPAPGGVRQESGEWHRPARRARRRFLCGEGILPLHFGAGVHRTLTKRGKGAPTAKFRVGDPQDGLATQGRDALATKEHRLRVLPDAITHDFTLAVLQSCRAPGVRLIFVGINGFARRAGTLVLRGGPSALFVGRASSHDSLPLGGTSIKRKGDVSRWPGKTSPRNVVAHAPGRRGKFACRWGGRRLPSLARDRAAEETDGPASPGRAVVSGPRGRRLPQGFRVDRQFEERNIAKGRRADGKIVVVDADSAEAAGLARSDAVRRFLCRGRPRPRIAGWKPATHNDALTGTLQTGLMPPAATSRLPCHSPVAEPKETRFIL